MDPDAALAAIREHVESLDNDADSSELAAHGQDLAHSVDGLDTWLTDGGHLPDDWRQAR